MFFKGKNKIKRALNKLLIFAMVLFIAGNSFFKAENVKADNLKSVKQVALLTEDAVEGPAINLESVDTTTGSAVNVGKAAPVITVNGLTDGQETSSSSLTFEASAMDDVDGAVTPVVKLNGEAVTVTDGKYTVTLKDGENTITVDASDKEGNKADEKIYKVVYSKPALSTSAAAIQLTSESGNLRAQVESAINSASTIATSNYNSMDWVAVGLVRAGKADLIPDDYIQGNIDYVSNPDNESTFYSKPTEFERMTLGILAAGGNPTNMGKYNFIKQIYTGDLKSQGINALIFGLIAIDAGDYYVPKDAKWTREKLIDAIINSKVDGGGWSFGGSEADPDMTGMAMTALAPYNNDKYSEVQKAISDAVKCLSDIQQEDGGYASWNTENSESCSQVLMGLCANKIDPTGAEFTKKNGNVVTALLNFKTSDGGFCHTEGDPSYGGGMTNGMANEQALYALDQYIYFLDSKGSIYNWGKQSPQKKTVNIRIEGNNEVILPFTSIITNSDNDVSIKDAVKQVLDENKITYTENGTGFSKIENDSSNSTDNEKWMCSVENGAVIKDLSSRYVSNCENIIVYLGKDTSNSYYTWLQLSDLRKASLFNPQSTKIFAGSDVDLVLHGLKVNNPNSYTSIDNISGAEVYVNGEEYKKDGIQVVTDKDGKFTVNFDKAGNYEVTVKKDSIRSANFTIKAETDTEPPTVNFSYELNNPDDNIKSDNTMDEFDIRPSDNKDKASDIKITVKLNDVEIKPSSIHDWNSACVFSNKKFDKYDNIIEVVVTDTTGNTKTITKHVINKNIKPSDKKVSIAREGEGSLKKGASADVAFNITNNQSTEQDVTLAVVLYNKDTNEMINYSCVKKTLKAGSTEKFAGGFPISSNGNYFVKAIVCDDLDPSKMNLLLEPVTIDVE